MFNQPHFEWFLGIERHMLTETWIKIITFSRQLFWISELGNKKLVTDY